MTMWVRVCVPPFRGLAQWILTMRADLAMPPDVSSKWPPTRNAHRPHSNAIRPEWASPPAGDAVSYVSVAVVVAPSTQTRYPECPAMRERERERLRYASSNSDWWLVAADASSGPQDAKVNESLTAGRAKKDMPNRAQQEAINLPCQVMGTMSP